MGSHLAVETVAGAHPSDRDCICSFSPPSNAGVILSTPGGTGTGQGVPKWVEEDYIGPWAPRAERRSGAYR